MWAFPGGLSNDVDAGVDRARLDTKEQEERRGRGNLIDWLSILGSNYSGRFFESKPVSI